MALLHELQQLAASDYDEREGKPTYGEFCNECLSKDANGTCNKKY